MKKYTKHGDKRTRLYNIWCAMKKRCNNKNCTEYRNYGGRGISVCLEWNDSYIVFKEWALHHGYSDSLTIERDNVNLGYYPENCRWITMAEQYRNKRDNRIITINGVSKTLIEFCEDYNMTMDYKTILKRLIDGWSHEDALSIPIRRFKKYNNPRKKRVAQYNQDGSFVKEWNNAKEASQETGYGRHTIYKTCQGLKSDINGYIFKYL